jgi:hypothetical protein
MDGNNFKATSTDCPVPCVSPSLSIFYQTIQRHIRKGSNLNKGRVSNCLCSDVRSPVSMEQRWPGTSDADRAQDKALGWLLGSGGEDNATDLPPSRLSPAGPLARQYSRL